MAEGVPHTTYIWTSPAASLGYGKQAEIRNPYFDGNPGPGNYERPKDNIAPEQVR
jgi:hypothetical protein